MKKRRSDKLGNVYPLTNKVICLECKQVFQKCGNGYLGCQDRKNKWRNCRNHKFIRLDELDRLIKEKFKEIFEKFYDIEYLNSLRKKEFDTVREEEVDILKKEEIRLKQKIEDKNKFFLKIYEDKVKGLLSDLEFLSLKNNYSDEVVTLESQIKNIRQEIDKLSHKKIIPFKQNIDLDNLPLEMISEFIDKIYIGKYDEIKNTRKIKIVWSFI